MRKYLRNLFRLTWVGDAPLDHDGLPIPDWQAAPIYYPLPGDGYLPPIRVRHDVPRHPAG